MAVPDVDLTHTAFLSDTDRDAIRTLLFDVFDDMTDSDVEHAYGGLHAMIWESGRLVGHASVVQRRLLHAGRSLRAGYVEAVAVRPDRQRQGLGGALMSRLERVIRYGYDLGGLGSTDEAVALYTAHGWRRWEGHASALTPAGVVATPDDEGAIYVLPVAVPLDLTAELTCDWRDGDVW